MRLLEWVSRRCPLLVWSSSRGPGRERASRAGLEGQQRRPGGEGPVPRPGGVRGVGTTWWPAPRPGVRYCPPSPAPVGGCRSWARSASMRRPTPACTTLCFVRWDASLRLNLPAPGMAEPRPEFDLVWPAPRSARIEFGAQTWARQVRARRRFDQNPTSPLTRHCGRGRAAWRADVRPPKPALR